MHSSVFEEEMAANAEGNPTMFPVSVPEGVEVIHNPSATGNETEDVSTCLLLIFSSFFSVVRWHKTGCMFHLLS